MKDLICTILCCLLLCALPAKAQEAVVYDDTWLNQRYDWVVYLNAKSVARFLDYPSSSLNPIVNVEVNCRMTPRITRNTSNDQTHYEDLWYHESQPIGCRRFCKLPFKEGLQGAICVSSTEDSFNNPAPIANAIVRLLLDVYANTDMLVVVLAPPSQESAICDQLGQFKFYRTKDFEFKDTGVQFMVSSGNIKDRTYMIYDPKR